MTIHSAAALDRLSSIDLELFKMKDQPQLERVRWSGDLHGPLLTAEVVQSFVNPGPKPVELIYNFPLPLGARLLRVQVQLGDRWLEGRVVDAAEASQSYEDALAEGHRAVLLEHRDAGSYSLSLGNLESGQTCSIHMHYAEVLPRRQGALRICVPTVIAPKFGSEAAAGLQPYQVAPHSALVEQAFDFKLRLHGELAKAAVASTTHRLSVRPGGGEHPMEIGLAAKAWLDRDLVVVLEHLADGALTIVSPPGTGSTQAMLALLEIAEPKAAPAAVAVAVKLLVDCSGSMAGERITSARASVHALLEELNEGDRLLLAQFGDAVRMRSRGLWRLTEATRTAATRWALGLQADMGGTEMAEALSAIFQANIAAETQADVLLLTDGDIHAVDETVLRARRSGHRVFVIGIGLSPNEVLVRRMAEETGGACEFVHDAATVPEALRRTIRRMRAPRRSALQWRFPQGCQVEWCSDAPLSVFPGDQVVLVAQFGTVLDASTVVELWAGDEQLAAVPCPGGTEASMSRPQSVLTWVTAQRVEALLSTARSVEAETEGGTRAAQLRSAAKALSLTHQLITRECSYVLVDQVADDERHSSMPGQFVMPAMLVGDQPIAASTLIGELNMDLDLSPRYSRRQASTDLTTRSAPSVYRLSRARSHQDMPNPVSTPALLRARLLTTRTKDWPQDFDDLRDWELGDDVVDWLELVAMPALNVSAPSLVKAFLVWVAGSGRAARLTWWRKLLPSRGTTASEFATEAGRLQSFFEQQFRGWHNDEWPIVVTQLSLQAS